ncbi:hypothetical protein EDB19DRAFT_2023997 [Suillus lakei]|nr:hypothetical protein EDB19DRAFT_2023997 [Suillus lakei]
MLDHQIVILFPNNLLVGLQANELIAMYADVLGDNAVKRYAMFLISLELTVPINEDVHKVAITAERTIDRAFELLFQMKGPLLSVVGLQANPLDIELLLLRCIEWTMSEDGTHDTALDHRHFAVLPSLDRVVECQSLEVSIMNRDTKPAWLSDYKGLIDQAYEAVVKLLTSDWMMPDETGDRRSQHTPEYKLYGDVLHINGQWLGEHLNTVTPCCVHDRLTVSPSM